MQLEPSMLEWWQWLMCAIVTGFACPYLISKGTRLQAGTDKGRRAIGIFLLFMGYASGIFALGSGMFVIVRLVKHG
jgi:hypothetical protein